MGPVKVGVLPPYRAGVAADPDWMTGFARLVESLGFESLYLVEHVVVPAGYATTYPYAPSGRMPLPEDCPIPDPFDLAAFLLARTDRLRLATGIVVAPHHHPLVLAKRAATLAVLSGDRFTLGVGVGWLREELEATGVDWATRGARTDECLDALRAIWTHQPASFAGERFAFEQVWSQPHRAVPLHVGGHSPAAARRAGRYGDGFQPLGLDDDLLAQRLVTMTAAAEAAGRDPAAIEVTLGVPLAELDRATVEDRGAVGAHRLLVSTGTSDLDRLADELAAAAERVGLADGRVR